MRLLDNELIYWNKDKYGWELQLPPRFLEIGHIGPTPGLKSNWYIEWRLPFRDWHLWSWSKDPLDPVLLAMKDK